MPAKMQKIGRISNKPLSLDPYLEILREKVTGDKKASVRRYCREKIRKLTHQEVPRNATTQRTGPKVPPPSPTARKRPAAA